ncbi:MAG: thioredoxin [Spirochaetaceae bacterium]|jgi:thioredoxin 1|nr:thioredoxin [Spirochaetaceae bacterium]
MGLEVTITSANFENEVLQSPVPVLVDFWADWCRPCKAVAPLLEQLAEEYSGRIKIAKVNVDEQNDLAGQHNIVSIPTMFIYKDGKVVRQKVGALPKHELEGMFKDLI